jgi:hypothetical protein
MGKPLHLAESTAMRKGGSPKEKRGGGNGLVLVRFLCWRPHCSVQASRTPQAGWKPRGQRLGGVVRKSNAAPVSAGSPRRLPEAFGGGRPCVFRSNWIRPPVFATVSVSKECARAAAVCRMRRSVWGPPPISTGEGQRGRGRRRGLPDAYRTARRRPSGLVASARIDA